MSSSSVSGITPVSYTHLDVYKRQVVVGSAVVLAAGTVVVVVVVCPVAPPPNTIPSASEANHIEFGESLFIA